MPLFKSTLFFRQGNYGWTETLYVTKNTITEAAASGMTLAGSRRGLSTDEVELFRVRTARADQPNVVQIDNITGSNRFGNFPSAPNTDYADDPFTCLLFNASTAEGRKRTLILRGIPEAIDVNAAYTPTTTWTSRMNSWINLLKQQQFQIRVSPPRSAETPISALAVDADDPYYLRVTSGVERPPTGSYVSIRGVKLPFGASAIHRVNLTTANGTYMLGPSRRAYARDPEWDGAGYLKVLTFSGQNITSLTPSRITKRDTGRPFGLPRGRRSAR